MRIQRKLLQFWFRFWYGTWKDRWFRFKCDCGHLLALDWFVSREQFEKFGYPESSYYFCGLPGCKNRDYWRAGNYYNASSMKTHKIVGKKQFYRFTRRRFREPNETNIQMVVKFGCGIYRLLLDKQNH